MARKQTLMVVGHRMVVHRPLEHLVDLEVTPPVRRGGDGVGAGAP